MLELRETDCLRGIDADARFVEKVWRYEEVEEGELKEEMENPPRLQMLGQWAFKRAQGLSSKINSIRFSNH